MVHRQQYNMLLRLQPDQAGAQQRAAVQVERRLCLVLRQPAGLGLAFGVRQAAQVGVRQRAGARGGNDLPRVAVDAGETGTQRFVAPHNLVEAALQRVAIEAAAQTHRGGHVVDRAAGLELVEEPQALLAERQRQRGVPIGRRDDGNAAGALFLARLHDALRQRFNGGGVEQRAQRQFQLEGGAQLRHHLRGQQRMAADMEEVFMHADLFVLAALQYLGPDAGQDFLLGRARADIGKLVGSQVRRRQRLALDLAVRRQRHPRQQHEVRRNHIVRQGARQRGAQPRRVRHVRPWPVLVRDQIRHQPLLARRILARQHHRFAHAVLRRQRRFDFAQLDAQATQLDLVVEPAQVLDLPVGQVARQVARLVQPRAGLRAERVRNELRGRQVGAVEVAARQPDAADVQLARHAGRHRIQLPVQDIDLGVGDRRADGYAGQFRIVPATPERDVDRGFGRAVQIVQGGLGQLRQATLLQGQRQGLAAANEQAQAAATRRLRRRCQCLQEHVEHRRYEVQRRDALCLDQFGQIGRLLVSARFRHDQRGTMGQRPEEFPDRDVETEWCLLQDPVGRRQGVGFLHPLQAVDDTGLVDADAFRFAGRAGGVDHISEVARQRARRRILGRIGGQRGVLGVETESRAGMRQAFQHPPLAQQHHWSGVFQDSGEAFGGIPRVQRHIGAAGFQDRQQTGHHVQRALGADAHQAVRADALLAQVMCQAVGAPVQFGITEFPPFERHGHPVRRARRLGFDHAVQRILGIDARRVVPIHQQLAPLGVRQQRQVGHAHVRLGHHRFQQARQTPRHPAYRRGVEQVGAVFERAQQLPALFLHIPGQVELGRRLRGWQRFEGQARQRQSAQRCILQHQHHLEQRRMAGVALGVQGLDQLLERQVLVRVRAQRGGAHLLQQVAERGVAVNLGAQHQRVDEEADQRLQFGPLAIGDRRADADVALPGMTGQQHIEGRRQGHEQRRPRLPAERVQARRGRLRNDERQAGAAIALRCRTCTVGRQR